MQEIVKNFLARHNLLRSEKTFLVGFSGGYDSLCLLDMLCDLSKEYHFKIVAMHLNHNWRGEESKLEEDCCRSFCCSSEIEFVSETIESPEKTESAAREARYEFFERIASKYQNSIILTAHTMSDNAETLIYRIIKGTGITGLKGIPSERKVGETFVYRPLLNVSRKEIEDYCKSKGLVPNNDSSNYDTNYKRNFIRHKIMPMFDEINFHAERSIASLAELAISQSNIVDEYMNKVRLEVYEGQKLVTSKYKKLSEDVMLKIIHDACKRENLDYDRKKINNMLQFIKNNFESKSGSRYSLTNNLWLFASSKYIYMITDIGNSENTAQVDINSEGSWLLPFEKKLSIAKFEEPKIDKFPKETDNYALVDFSNVGLENLTFRTRRDGDFIVPFGMTGKMKLKKYLNEKKIPQHEKNSLLMLCKGNEVLWIVGVGLSNKLRVVNMPTHVIKFSDR